MAPAEREEREQSTESPDLLSIMDGFYPYSNQHGEYYMLHSYGQLELEEAKEKFERWIIEGIDEDRSNQTEDTFGTFTHTKCRFNANFGAIETEFSS